MITGITSLFRGGPLDGRTAQLQTAANELAVTRIVRVVDGEATVLEHQADELAGRYRLVEGVQVDFARPSAESPSIWLASSSVLDGAVYEWEPEAA